MSDNINLMTQKIESKFNEIENEIEKNMTEKR